MVLSLKSVYLFVFLRGVESYSETSLVDNRLNDSDGELFPHLNMTSASSPALSVISYAVPIAVILFVLMSATLLYCLCGWFRRRRRQKEQLAALTPSPDPWLAGVRSCQPVQFVVPATIAISETDSVSDGSSGGTLPILLNRRKRHALINPQDLQCGLYVGVKAASEKGHFLGDLGQVGFSLSYNPARSQLTVNLIGCSDLPCHALKTTANPCAKVVLLPDRTTKFMSRVQRNTISPRFDEKFHFSVRKDDLQDKRIRISIWDYDCFSRRCLLGQITYNVRDAELTNDQLSTGDIWIHLKPDAVSHAVGEGEVLFSLCYNPDSANLRLTVLKARALNATTTQEKGKETSVYAKVTLYVRRKLIRSKKTPIRRKAADVEFDSTFDVHMPQSALGEVDFLVALCEKGPGLSSTRKLIGRTQVGANCLCDQGLQHWQDMLLSPKSTCAQWHILNG